jgi:Domain of unknown function (DUF4145)
MREYEPPSAGKTAFHCPFCGTYAQQYWSPLFADLIALASMPPNAPPIAPKYEQLTGYTSSLCVHCGQWGLWVELKMMYPPASTAPLPLPDMPDEVAADFKEARDVLVRSPRSAAALLRLALQKLMKHLNLPGDKLDDDISALVKQGLRPQVQQALDIVRVTGNNAVHPGELDIRDNVETATMLFKLVNIVVEQMITQPREIEGLYGSLPEGSRQAIGKRDTKSEKPRRN